MSKSDEELDRLLGRGKALPPGEGAHPQQSPRRPRGRSPREVVDLRPLAALRRRRPRDGGGGHSDRANVHRQPRRTSAEVRRECAGQRGRGVQRCVQTRGDVGVRAFLTRRAAVLRRVRPDAGQEADLVLPERGTPDACGENVSASGVLDLGIALGPEHVKGTHELHLVFAKTSLDKDALKAALENRSRVIVHHGTQPLEIGE